MSRTALHRLLIAICAVFLVLAALAWVTGVVRAPAGGPGVAGLWDGWAMFALVVAIAVGTVDFFVRPLGGRSGDADVLADAEEARTGSTRTHRPR
jgi:ABC-type Fe3+-siderophore transport system permease subunit